MDSKIKAIRWLHLARALLNTEPTTKEFQRLARQAVSRAEKHLIDNGNERQMEGAK